MIYKVQQGPIKLKMIDKKIRIKKKIKTEKGS